MRIRLIDASSLHWKNRIIPPANVLFQSLGEQVLNYASTCLLISVFAIIVAIVPRTLVGNTIPMKDVLLIIGILSYIGIVLGVVLGGFLFFKRKRGIRKFLSLLYAVAEDTPKATQGLEEYIIKYHGQEVWAGYYSTTDSRGRGSFRDEIVFFLKYDADISTGECLQERVFESVRQKSAACHFGQTEGELALVFSSGKTPTPMQLISMLDDLLAVASECKLTTLPWQK